MVKVGSAGQGAHRPDADVIAPDDRLSSRHNSLNALRLVLAMVVVVSHVPKVRGQAPLALGDVEIGGWAVAGFFGISGWLVTQSRLRLPLGEFLWRRLLRILPGFWVCLLVTGFVAAPIAALAGPGRWSPVAAARYLFANLTLYITQAKIGNTLHGRPDPSTWNLSLWTLSYEFLCYLGIAILLCAAVARRRPSVTVWAFVLVATVNAGLVWGGTARDTTLQLVFRLGSFFLAGALLLRCRRIAFTGWGALAALAILIAAAATDQVRVFGALPVAYLCLWLARVLPFQSIGRRNDLSYGVYVYAFPLQQLLTFTGARHWSTPAFAALSMVAVLPLALLSWRVVEQPALRLKAAWPRLVRIARREPPPGAAGAPTAGSVSDPRPAGTPQR